MDSYPENVYYVCQECGHVECRPPEHPDKCEACGSNAWQEDFATIEEAEDDSQSILDENEDN